MQTRIDTQRQHILEWLQAGRSITPLEALQNFGAFRLSGHIFVLKQRGYDITTEIVEQGGKRFAKYSIKA